MHINISISDSADVWYNTLMNNQEPNDFIIIENNKDELIWFITNLSQFLIRKGNSEVALLYGNLINGLDEFIYQINMSLPIGYQVGKKFQLNALHDMLLNFETEPAQRFIIWNDASFLYRSNIDVFVSIFETMVVAAYCNRKGIATQKIDGNPYMVDQRNIIVIKKEDYQGLKLILDKQYYIPSLTLVNNYEKRLDFNLIELIK